MITHHDVRRHRGQGLSEYLIILVLVTVALITAVTAFGGKMGEIFESATKTIDSKVKVGGGKQGIPNP